MFGGSPFSAGSWAFGGRSSRATAPTVRVLIGDGWPSGARVQLEFPYTFRSAAPELGCLACIAEISC